MALADRYQYQVVNDDMDQAVEEICDILTNAMGEEPTMIDELREEEIVKKVGGRFKLSTLIQKRLVQLNAGARPLVDAKNDNKMQIVINEIMQDKIYLDTDLNVQIAAGSSPPDWTSAPISVWDCPDFAQTDGRPVHDEA